MVKGGEKREGERKEGREELRKTERVRRAKSRERTRIGVESGAMDGWSLRGREVKRDRGRK